VGQAVLAVRQGVRKFEFTHGINSRPASRKFEPWFFRNYLGVAGSTGSYWTPPFMTL
jgi:hypothetical protein